MAAINIGRRLSTPSSSLSSNWLHQFQFRLCKTYNYINKPDTDNIKSKKKIVSVVASDFTLTNPLGINTRWGQSLHLKLCKTAQEHPEILFLKVNFNENKPKNSNVKDVLPYFHFYRGPDGQLVSFSRSRSKRRKRMSIEVD